jgi:hypothetical protein
MITGSALGSVSSATPAATTSGGERVPLFHDGEGLTGQVFAYAEQLTAPYSFTGVGEDTLYLNGYAHMPRHRGETQGTETVTSEVSFDVAEAVEVMKRIGDEAETAGAAAPTKEEGLAAALQVYLAWPQVEWATIDGEHVIVEFTIMPTEVVRAFHFMDDGPQSFAGRSRRDEMLVYIQRVWRSMSLGRLQVFGTDYFVDFGRPIQQRPWRSLRKLKPGGWHRRTVTSWERWRQR